MPELAIGIFLFVEKKTETLMIYIRDEYSRIKRERKGMIKNRKINEKDITYLIRLYIIRISPT